MREFSSELTGEISGKHANVDMQRTPEKIHLRSKVRCAQTSAQCNETFQIAGTIRQQRGVTLLCLATKNYGLVMKAFW